MSIVRVWLSGWEWECCGDPFTAGSTVTFSCHPPQGNWFVEQFGADFAATIALVEEHHDDGGDDPPVRMLAGTVRAIHAVIVDERVIREPGPSHTASPPRPGAEPGAASSRSAASERFDLGNGVSVGFGVTRPYVLTAEPMLGTVRLRAASRVPTKADRDATGSAEAGSRPDPEESAIVARSPGWVVDVEI